MRNFLKTGIFIAAVGMLSACTTSVTLTTSPPGVDVFIDGKNVGKTPLSLSEKNLGKKAAGGHRIKLISEGYKPVHLWFPVNTRGLELQVNMWPFKREDSARNAQLFQGRLTKLSSVFLETQADLLQGKSSGLEKANLLLKEYPQYAATHFLAAVASVRKSDKGNALKQLEQALKLSPSDPVYAGLYRELGGQESKLYRKNDNEVDDAESTTEE